MQLDFLGSSNFSVRFYCDPYDVMAHTIAIALFEKEMSVDFSFFLPGDAISEKIAERGIPETKTLLIDRTLILHSSQVILEYLDERFPYPPLMPVDPITRAQNRQLRTQIRTDLFGLLEPISPKKDARNAKRKRAIIDYITGLSSLVERDGFLGAEDFSLADCLMLALFWQIKWNQLEVPSEAITLHKYMNRLMSRQSFKKSISQREKYLCR